MGTSVNQSSAPSANWSAVQAGYRTTVPVGRVVQEIWRAATNQHEGDLVALLRQPIIAKIGQLARQRKPPQEVAADAARAITKSKTASLATDIARRAAVQAALSPNPAETYGQRLFAEAANYLIARDLPGFVGGDHRNKSVPDAITFKDALLQNTVSKVKAAGPADFSSTKRWDRYITTVIESLKGKP
jgi:hypothetical protein